MKEEKDLLDSKIWVENRIEELMQEVKDLVNKRIDDLDYEKTTMKLESSISDLNTQINQFSHDKDRAIENLEEDLNLRINDLKILKRNILEQRAEEIIEQRLSKSEEKMNESSKNTNEKLTEQINELKEEQDKEFKESKQKIDLLNTQLDERIEDLKTIKEQFSTEIDEKNKETIEILNKKIEEESDTRDLERDIINKLAELRDKQEEFMLQRLKEQDKTDEINKINQELENLLNELENRDKKLEQKNIKNYEDYKVLLEKSISRMNYATTMKKINENFIRLNKKITEIGKDNSKREKSIINLVKEWEAKSSKKSKRELKDYIELVITEKINNEINICIEKQVKKALKTQLGNKPIEQVKPKIINKENELTIDQMLLNKGIEIKSKNKIIEAAKQVEKMAKIQNKSQILNINKED